MTLQEMLDSRALPDIAFPATATGWWKRHMELQQLLCQEAYGQLPPPPIHLSVNEVTVDERFCAGKAPLNKLRFTVTLPGGKFFFPVSLVIPRSKEPCPAIVLINFRPDVPDKYLPSEELADRGYAVASFCYRDVTADNSDFPTALPECWALTVLPPMRPES